MRSIIGRINRAVDSFTDVLVENVSPLHEVETYSFHDLNRFIRKIHQQYPIIKKCTVSISKSNQAYDKIYPTNKFIIQVVMLDEEGKTISVGRKDEYLGLYVVASSIDQRLLDFMNGKLVRTVKLKTEEV